LYSTLSMSDHVDGVLQKCSGTLFPLQTLRAHEMSDRQVHTVFASVAVARLAYAALSWHGFASARDLARVEGFMRRSMRWGMCTPSTPLFKVYCIYYDARLFKRVSSSPYHTLHHLFYVKPAGGYRLRPRVHNYEIPCAGSKLLESNFSIRILREYA